MARGLCLFYFLLGVQLTLPDLSVSLWMIRVGVDVAKMTALNATIAVPWCLKPLYGLIADSHLLCGRSRRSYIIAGNLVAAAGWLSLALLPKDHPHALSIGMGLLVLTSLATCFVDVMYDALLVVAVRRESARDHGKTQSDCWAARAAGALLAALVSGFTLGIVRETRDMFLIQAALTALTAVLGRCLIEERPQRAAQNSGCFSGCCSVWRERACTVIGAWRATPALWRSALFVFAFAATPSSYGALFYYLVVELRFSAGTLGVLDFAKHAAMLMGTLLYRKCCRRARFRQFFVVVVLFSALLSCTPVLLVTHANTAWNIPDVAFATGDDVALSIVGQIAQMPLLVLAAKLCPAGVEATLYASFVSIMNFSSVVSGWTGALFMAWWGVSRDNFDNLEPLILSCAATSLLPLFFIWLLPRGAVGDLVRG
jgi:folate/biopterin transporter